MIYCNQCGTQNREGSRFCNACGTRLQPPVGVLCPSCGMDNQVGAAFCSNCGTRIVSLTAAPARTEPPAAAPVKGLTLPAKPAAPAPATPPSSAETEKAAPAPTEQPPAEPAPQPPAPEPAKAEEEEIPDWLASLRQAAAAAEESAQPADKPEEPTQLAKGPAEQPASEASEEPDWLAHLRQASQAQEDKPPVQAAPAKDWLTELREQGPEVEPSAPAPVSSEAEDPSWIQRMREEVASAASALGSTPTEEEPSWIKHLQAEEESPTPADEAVPDWLYQLRTQTPEAPAEEAGVAEEIPSQPLQVELPSPTPEETPAPTEMPPAIETQAEEELPEEKPSEPQIPSEPLAAAEPFAPAEPSVPAESSASAEPLAPAEPSAAEAEPPAPAVEIPDWLKELRAAKPETAQSLEAFLTEEEPPSQEPKTKEPVSPQPVAPLEEPIVISPPREKAAETEPSPSELEGVPDWLRMPIPSPAQVGAQGLPLADEVAQPKLEPVPTIEPARPDEVPAWIAALKPPELMEAPAPMDLEPMETSGPLAGLRGVLPLALAITQPHPPHAISVPADGQNGAHLFGTILAQPVTEAEEAAAPKVRAGRTARPFIYTLLLLAVIVPFFLPAGLAGAALPIANTPAAEFYDKIQQLPANATVLVAFDYDPSVAGEMNLQANALVRDLVRRRIKIVALSTLETGPFLAQRVLDQATAGNADYRYGTDFVNIGYLPGHEAGLAQLAAQGLPANATDFVEKQPLGQLPLISNWDSSKAALVVEFAGAQAPLKMWMEQFQGRVKVPMLAGVSAAVEPQAHAYRGANQLAGMLSGLMGAAQYEILSNSTGLAVTSVNAQGAAQLVLVLVIILGNIAFLASRRETRKND